MSLSHDVTLWAKRAFFAGRGEPYAIAGHRLRFVPGTRPTRLKYADSSELVARYDAREIQAIVDGVRPGDTVLDVGANAGQFGILLAALTGREGLTICFEPDPAARDLLARNIQLNPRVTPPLVEPIALADSIRRQTFFVDSRSSANSSLTKASFADKKFQEIEVECRTLDDYVAERRISPDWIKIDTERAEIGILRGASQTLAGPAHFLVELHPYAWPDFRDTFEELQDIVARSGRRLRYLDRDEPLNAAPTYGVVTLERLPSAEA